MRLRLLVAVACVVMATGCGLDDTTSSQLPEAPPAGLQPVSSDTQAPWPATDPSAEAGGPSLDIRILRSMLYAAAVEHHVNPYLVMGLAWHESGWQPSVVSSAGAVGMMQVMPATAAVDGPWLLHRNVDLYDPGDNIELGTAILKNNLDTYHDDLAKALTDYYAGGSAVTDWAHLRADCRRYVWAVYNAAIMFEQGRGPA